jgi:hypothetical protein
MKSGKTTGREPRKQRRTRGRAIYWDTCIFLAWIKNENVWPDDVMKGIEQTIEMALSGQVVIVTSSLTRVEALSANLTKDQKQKFVDAFNSPQIQLMDLDRRIADRAAAIRDHYDTRKLDTSGKVVDGGPMSMGDSVHLATAIHFKVDVFNTLDGSGKRQRRVDLLKLTGDVDGYPLAIKIPEFIPPPEPLVGPQSLVKGQQPSLFEQEENNETKTSEAKTEPESADVRSGGDGHPEDQAGGEVAEEEGKSKAGRD